MRLSLCFHQASGEKWKIDNNGGFLGEMGHHRSPCSCPQWTHQKVLLGQPHQTASFPFRDFSCFPPFIFVCEQRQNHRKKISVVPKVETDLSHFSSVSRRWLIIRPGPGSGPAEIRRAGPIKEQVVTDDPPEGKVRNESEHLLQTNKKHL